MLKYGFTIYGKEYTPSEFFVTENNVVFVHNIELGFFEHPKHSGNENNLMIHCFNMVKEGFTIEPFTRDPLEKIEKKHKKFFEM